MILLKALWEIPLPGLFQFVESAFIIKANVVTFSNLSHALAPPSSILTYSFSHFDSSASLFFKIILL